MHIAARSLLPLALAMILAACTPSAPDAGKTADATAGKPVVASGYTTSIQYPDLRGDESGLANILHARGAEVRKAFMQNVSSRRADQPPWQLAIRFSIASRTARFTSIQEQGMADTGGAHPRPVERGYVFDRQAGTLVSLDDLFTHPQQAREGLAVLARKQLEASLLAGAPDSAEASPQARKEWVANMRAMIGQGTRPTTTNYRNFVLLAGAGDKAAGIELIFPPYQVAPYVNGTQRVDINADAFAAWLKPAWRDAFDLQ